MDTITRKIFTRIMTNNNEMTINIMIIVINLS